MAVESLVILSSPISPYVIQVEPDNAAIVAASTQGPPGPPGPAGQAVSTQDLTASSTISAYTVVALSNGQAAIADSSIPSQIGNVIGVSKNGAAQGATVTVQYGGPVTYNGWDWTLGLPVFVGTTGRLTQTSPSSGFNQIIGFPINSTTLLVLLQSPTLIA